MIKKTYFLIIVMLVCLVLILAPLKAQAETITFGLDYLYCAHAPDGTDLPWLTATFVDTGTPGTVDLTLSSSGLINEEYVASWYFNLDTALDAEKLVISRLGSGNNDIYDNTIIDTGNNLFHAASDGAFDILFDFSQNASGNCSLIKRFLAGIELKYTITGTGSLSNNISASSFNLRSEAPGGSDNRIFYSAAHVLRSPFIGPGFHDSDCTCPICSSCNDRPNHACSWIADPAPEPCTMILLGSGLLGIAGLRRKLKN